jgi:hypothetical protein
MRSVTTPLFPAQIAGAVTLQAVIDAREGDRLPHELALYVSGELGKQVAELQKIGREASLDPQRVWCTSKGAVVVPEAAPGEPRGLGALIYRLLSGSREVSAWPPSYFNPLVGDSLDAAVMSAVDTDKPEETRAMVDALSAAASGLDPEASVTGMARLVFAVSDEPKAAPGIAAVTTAELDSIQRNQPWLNPRRAAGIAGGALALLLVMIALAISGPAKVVVAPPVAQAPVVQVKSVREKTVEAFRAKKLLETASAKATTLKKGRAKAK